MPRTSISFTDHIVSNVIKKANSWELCVPGTNHLKIVYTVIDGVLLVTGDFGSWIFDKPFTPFPANISVPVHYWAEKAELRSEQSPYEYDPGGTSDMIQQFMADNKDSLSDVETDYLDRCLSISDDEVSYLSYAYNEMPDTWDSESVMVSHKLKPSFLAIIDGFEAICYKLLNDA